VWFIHPGLGFGEGFGYVNCHDAGVADGITSASVCVFTSTPAGLIGLRRHWGDGPDACRRVQADCGLSPGGVDCAISLGRRSRL
jgi:hypothetical protein